MRAGDLDVRVGLVRFAPAVTKDAFGQPVRTPPTPLVVWANRTPVRDGERFNAQQQGASLTDRFTIRWSDEVKDLSAKDQLVCDGVTFAIVGKPKALDSSGKSSGRVWIEITAQAQG